MVSFAYRSLHFLIATVTFDEAAAANVTTSSAEHHRSEPESTETVISEPESELGAVVEAEPNPVTTVVEVEPESSTTTIELETTPEVVTVSVAEPASEDASNWYDKIDFGLFVDAYASFNGSLPELQAGQNVGRAFDAANGFSFAWAGANLAYETDKVGATLDLRFGPATNAGWADDQIPGIQHAKQAYVTYKPFEKLSFDLGRFDTIYGGEVSESWMNHTYTRGFLYNLAQPFWHTGLRVNGTINDKFAITAMVVNGWGYVWDNNKGKGYGLQFGITPIDSLGIYLGYLGSPESDGYIDGIEVEDANKSFRHLADVVVAYEKGKFGLTFNGDFIYEDAATASVDGGGVVTQSTTSNIWYGAMASFRYAPLDWFAVAARAEFLGDPDGALVGGEVPADQEPTDILFGSGTATLEFMPAEELSIRLEGRYDGANRDIFNKSNFEKTSNQGTVTLGVVVHTF